MIDSWLRLEESQVEFLGGGDYYKTDYSAVAAKSRGVVRMDRNTLFINNVSMVGAERFELPTLCSQSRCATRLRYAPTVYIHHCTSD